MPPCLAATGSTLPLVVTGLAILALVVGAVIVLVARRQPGSALVIALVAAIALGGLAAPTPAAAACDPAPPANLELSDQGLVLAPTDFFRIDTGFTKTLTIRNTSSTITVTGIVVAGIPAGVTVTSTCANLAPGASCTVDLLAAPTQPTVISPLQVTGTNAALATTNLYVNATAVFSAPSNAVNAPDGVEVFFTVTNIGQGDATDLSDLIGGDTGAFAITQNDCSGTATVPAGGTCTVGVRYNAALATTGILTVTYSADFIAPYTVTVTGTP